MFNGRFIFYIRDRILHTLVKKVWPTALANLVDEKLSHEDVLVFGYDRHAPLLSNQEIDSIYLDQEIFRKRLAIFKNVCQFSYFGGSDADYLVSLGRMDLVDEMLYVVKSEGFIPLLLCQYPSMVLPEVEKAGIDVDGYVIPLNRVWSWFTHKDTVQAVQNTEKPVIAFMALSSKELREDVEGALRWLYQDAGVESVLFGTATPEHAKQTTEIALSIKHNDHSLN
jgi:hypothetical protein